MRTLSKFTREYNTTQIEENKVIRTVIADKERSLQKQISKHDEKFAWLIPEIDSCKEHFNEANTRLFHVD